MHRLANTPYLSRSLFSALPSVAPYCVPGGVRVVSKVRGLRVAGSFALNARVEIRTAARNRANSRSAASTTWTTVDVSILINVEPRGIEPLTSAVRKRRDALLALSRHCKIAAKPLEMMPNFFLTLQDVYPGCCTRSTPGMSRDLRPSDW